MGPQQRRLWRNGDFLKLWGGQSVSLVGSQVTLLALPLTAILTLQATPLQLGILSAAEFAPYLLVTLFAGVWVDRSRRRPVLIGADVGRAALLALIPLGATLGLLRIEALYVIAFAFGVLTVLFDLAYQSYLPSLVSSDQLLNANGKLQVSGSVAQIGGPGLAGILISAVSAPLAILTDSASFVVSALGLLMIRARESSPPRERGQLRGIWRRIGAGLALLLRDPHLRPMAAEAATSNLFGTAIGTLLILYAVRDLGLSPALYGGIIALGSFGALFGALLAHWCSRRLRLGRALMAAYTLVCASPLLVPLAAGSMTVSILVLASFELLSGIGLTMSNIYVITLRQTIVPAELFGRVNASYRFLVSGAVPVGALLAGALGNTLGVRPTLAVCACGMLLALPWAYFSPLRRLRELPAHKEEKCTPDIRLHGANKQVQLRS